QRPSRASGPQAPPASTARSLSAPICRPAAAGTGSTGNHPPPAPHPGPGAGKLGQACSRPPLKPPKLYATGPQARHKPATSPYSAIPASPAPSPPETARPHPAPSAGAPGASSRPDTGSQRPGRKAKLEPAALADLEPLRPELGQLRLELGQLPIP